MALRSQPLNITGTVTLGGNAFTVNTANGLPLANGTYVVAQASGTITSIGTYPAVTGTGIGSGSQGAISVLGTQVILTVSTATVLPPANISFSRSGSTLTLTWPGRSPRLYPPKQLRESDDTSRLVQHPRLQLSDQLPGHHPSRASRTFSSLRLVSP